MRIPPKASSPRMAFCRMATIASAKPVNTMPRARRRFAVRDSVLRRPTNSSRLAARSARKSSVFSGATEIGWRSDREASFRSRIGRKREPEVDVGEERYRSRAQPRQQRKWQRNQLSGREQADAQDRQQQKAVGVPRRPRAGDERKQANECAPGGEGSEGPRIDGTERESAPRHEQER